MTNPSQEMEALLPCPFCGGEAEITCGSTVAIIVAACTNKKCPVQPTVGYFDRALTERAWNTRPTSVSVQAGESVAFPYQQTFDSKEPKATFDPEYIRDLSERVYRVRLEQDSAGNVNRMIAKDKDCGKKLRARAGSYDPLTRAYLKVLGFEPAGLVKALEGIAEFCSADASKLGAIERLASIRNTAVNVLAHVGIAQK